MLESDAMAATKIKTNIYLEPELIEALDRARKAAPGFQSRAELIRELLWEALAARATQAKKS